MEGLGYRPEYPRRDWNDRLEYSCRDWDDRPEYPWRDWDDRPEYHWRDWEEMTKQRTLRRIWKTYQSILLGREDRCYLEKEDGPQCSEGLGRTTD